MMVQDAEVGIHQHGYYPVKLTPYRRALFTAAITAA